MFKTVRAKLLTVFSVFLLIFLLLQFLFNTFFAEDFYIFQKKHEINQVFEELKLNYSDEQETIYKIVNKYEEKYNVRVFVFGESERGLEFIYTSLPDWQMERRDFFPAPRFFDRNIDDFSPDAKATLQKAPNDAKNLFLRGIIEFNGNNRYVMLESPVASIKQTATVTTQITTALFLILSLLGMVYFYIFARRLTKPISEIDEVAKSVVSLDFSKKAKIPKGRDEITHLAQNINIMSDKISEMLNELQKSNQRLEKDIEYKTKLENIRKEFVANVSHELKTPIALLMGYTEMLKSDIPNIDKDFYYDVIMDESEKMNELVCELLKVSEMENELCNLEICDVNLKELVQWTVEKNKIYIDKNHLELTSYFEDITVKCDKLEIEKCIVNYISNAIFHSNKGCKIDVKLYKEGNKAVFSVFNEGGRISEEDKEKIWNIFYKADKSRSERKSTGLGLYIVSSVINAHKGEYGFINHKNGVEFYFKLFI